MFEIYFYKIIVNVSPKFIIMQSKTQSIGSIKNRYMSRTIGRKTDLCKFYDAFGINNTTTILIKSYPVLDIIHAKAYMQLSIGRHRASKSLLTKDVMTYNPVDGKSRYEALVDAKKNAFLRMSPQELVDIENEIHNIETNNFSKGRQPIDHRGYGVKCMECDKICKNRRGVLIHASRMHL